jgi:H+-transporting ATPase
MPNPKSPNHHETKAAPPEPPGPTDLNRGLSTGEALARISRFGRNEVVERQPNPYGQFALRFWGPSAGMLEAIIALSIFLHKPADAVVAALLLVANAVVGFFEEHRASNVVEALRQRLHVRARVLRDGAWGALAAEDLVPGDVVRVRLGDFVPADVQVATGDIRVDQAALTGESAEVARVAGELLYAGSIVRRGEATGIVTATGVGTFFGRTTELVARSRPKGHAQQVVGQVVGALFIVVGALVGAAVVMAVLHGAPLLDLLPLVLVLLMSAVPMALPVMFTVSAAVGAAELSHKGVLVTRLDAGEDVAHMDVLCVDKTGTLTLNRLTVDEVLPETGWTADEVLRFGALASQDADQDPIDLAFIAAAHKKEVVDPTDRVTRFEPFDPSTRRTEAAVTGTAGSFDVTKGAVHTIAALCAVDPSTLDARSSPAAARGCRAIAVARRQGGGFVLVGIVLLRDPPRPDSRELITRLRGLGVTVKMLTGDALPVARSVAAEVGLGSIEPASALREALADPAQLDALLTRTDGFAEVFPEDKHGLVVALQHAGHIVGMTGDGVNDAPALKQAEVGIAVRGATDVARGAASVVLTEEGLIAVLDLVLGGRRIYQRLLTWIVNKISRTILKAGFVSLAFFATGRFVISAFAMVLLVFLTDFAKVSLATDAVRVSERPDRWDLPGWTRIGAVLGVLLTAEALGLLFAAQRALGVSVEQLPTFAFLTLLWFALFSLVSVREHGAFWRSVPSRWVMAGLGLEGVAGLVVATLGLPGLPSLDVRMVTVVFVSAATASLLINDVVKRWLIRRFAPPRKTCTP